MKHFREFMNFFYAKHFKKSLFFDLMARFGAFYFSIVKLLQGKPKEKVAPNYYILISDNETLKEKLAIKFQKNVERIILENTKAVFSQTFSKDKKIEIILDTNYLSFKEAITLLEENKNKRFTFKIVPMQSNFIIGSNSSNDRGEVVLI
jgi:hypothetical protein